MHGIPGTAGTSQTLRGLTQIDCSVDRICSVIDTLSNKGDCRSLGIGEEKTLARSEEAVGTTGSKVEGI
jgi:hypothetical protein